MFLSTQSSKSLAECCCCGPTTKEGWYFQFQELETNQLASYHLQNLLTYHFVKVTMTSRVLSESPSKLKRMLFDIHDKKQTSNYDVQENIFMDYLLLYLYKQYINKCRFL